MISLDKQLFYFLNSLAKRNAILDIVWVFLAKYCIFIFGLILIYLLFKDRALFYKIILGLIISIVIVELIKKSLFFPRPFLQENIRVLIAHQPDSAFPSKHATVAFAIAFGIFLKKKKLGMWLLVLAFLVSLSRVVAGVHYPLDILAGALIGTCVAYVNNRFIKNSIIRLPT